MIASISGEILEIQHESIVINVQGIGFLVYVPTTMLSQLSVGEVVHLYTLLIVREESLTLFGFDNKETRELFSLLLGVNGVGPRIALALISSLSIDTIRIAILQEHADVFARVPGVGRKTAQKILIHLQDKVKQMPGEILSSPHAEIETHVLSALTSLGYSVVESQSAIQAIPRDTPLELEDQIRAALRYFSK